MCKSKCADNAPTITVKGMEYFFDAENTDVSELVYRGLPEFFVPRFYAAGIYTIEDLLLAIGTKWVKEQFFFGKKSCIAVHNALTEYALETDDLITRNKIPQCQFKENSIQKSNVNIIFGNLVC